MVKVTFLIKQSTNVQVYVKYDETHAFGIYKMLLFININFDSIFKKHDSFQSMIPKKSVLFITFYNEKDRDRET